MDWIRGRHDERVVLVGQVAVGLGFSRRWLLVDDLDGLAIGCRRRLGFVREFGGRWRRRFFHLVIFFWRMIRRATDSSRTLGRLTVDFQVAKRGAYDVGFLLEYVQAVQVILQLPVVFAIEFMERVDTRRYYLKSIASRVNRSGAQKKSAPSEDRTHDLQITL
jgi:hypothetical protein